MLSLDFPTFSLGFIGCTTHDSGEVEEILDGPRVPQLLLADLHGLSKSCRMCFFELQCRKVGITCQR